MNRRGFLAAGVLGALAGCVGGRRRGTDANTPTLAAGGGSAPTADVELPVPMTELERGAPKDGIPAITDPTFGPDWSGLELTVRGYYGNDVVVEPRLGADDPVIGVERDGEARAYPLAVLNWHEVVNDDLGGPLLVTYCPLCGSGVVGERVLDRAPATFGVSGYLFRNDLVMYDAGSGSLWSQVLATAIRGPRTGETLDLVPSTLTTWGAWREAHPAAVVLRPPPESNTVRGRGETRNYTRDTYAGYESSGRVGIGGEYDDGRLHPKATVLGITHAGVARAYPLQAVLDAGVVNDAVAGRPVVVTVGPGETLVGYRRTVDGEVLALRAGDDRHVVAGGSRWVTTTGTAVSGPHEGARLTRASAATPMFFFAWQDFNPDTEVFGA